MQELISVIVPIYNIEKYIEKCIASISSQTYKNLEIILIDDGSTDSSGSICDTLAKNDPRIKVIHKKNGGLSDARNAGLEVAEGEYFSFIDGDDFITPDTLEKLYNAAVSTDSEISVCNMLRYYEDGSTVDFYCPSTAPVTLEGIDRFKTLNQPSVCNKLFKAELFGDLRFPKSKYYEDTYIYHILAYNASKATLTGHNGYMYLSRRDSILGANISERYFDCIEAIYNRLVFLAEHGIDIYAKEAALSLYAAVANAQKGIKKTSSNQKSFENARKQYLAAYRYLMHRSSGISFKQKIRLFLLKYAPMLHNKLY